MFLDKKPMMPTAESALPGREQAIEVTEAHFVNGQSMYGPFADHLQLAMFGLGCFWGAEKQFWQQPGVFVTMVGYAGGYTQNPTYQEVCTGQTGHNEVIRLAYDPAQLSYEELLKVFWQSHDPTQGMRQGNDVGTQYRSGIYFYGEQQRNAAEESMRVYQARLLMQGFGEITTEILSAPTFYFAEPYHQQYLAKNPQGYCGLGGTGVTFS